MRRRGRKHDAAELAVRVRNALARRRNVTEKRMFGGVCFMARGNMLCGAASPGYMFRVGAEQHEAALRREGASAIVMRGRKLKGFVWVDPEACDARGLKAWIALAQRHVSKLPSKGAR